LGALTNKAALYSAQWAPIPSILPTLSKQP
jgi:hypothetical protein